MNQLIVGVVVNTLLFGYMGSAHEKSGISHLIPPFINNTVLKTVAPFLYFLSFAIILLAPGGLIRNIIIAIALQFFINHIVWGSITGVLAGLVDKKRLTSAKKID